MKHQPQQREQHRQELREQLRQKLKERLQARPQTQLLLVAMSRIKEATTMLSEQRGDHGLLYLMDALEIIESIRGTYHYETAKLYVALGVTLQSLEKYPRAKQSYQKAIEIYQMIAENQEPNPSGGTIYTQRYIQAWMGLGTTNSSMEKWHEAMKAFQSAARLELYNLLVATSKNPTRQSEGPTSQGHSKDSMLVKQRKALSSVRQLQELMESIEKYHYHNRKQVWSHFPQLPQEFSSYLDTLQATVQHEIQGDGLYQQEKFGAAAREYQTALVLFQEQVHSSQQSGISLDAIWLLRKQALAQFHVARMVESSKGQDGMEETIQNHLSIEIPLNHLTKQGFQPTCPGLDKACETLVMADSLLRDARFDHQQLLRAFYRFEEAKELAKLYQTTQASMDPQMQQQQEEERGEQQQPHPQQSSLSILEDMKRTLEELQHQLVPEGLSQSSSEQQQTIKANRKRIWQELQHLSILVEAQESLLTNSIQQPPPQPQSGTPHAPPTVGVCTAGNAISSVKATDHVAAQGIGLIIILLASILVPMFISRKNTVGPRECEDKNEKKIMTPTDDTKKEESGSLDCQQQVLKESDESEKSPEDDTTRIHVIPPALPREETKSATTDTTGNNSGKAIAMLQSLDRMETELQGLTSQLNNGTLLPELLANKVSALVILQKTRQALLARVMGEVEDEEDDKHLVVVVDEDENDDDEAKADINNSSGVEMEIQFQRLIHRMRELGFESLVTDDVEAVTLENK